jgi:SAM-dependent methyltransferase
VIPINKTMHRDDLLAPEAMQIVDDLNVLIHRLYSSGVSMTSWYGTLREDESRLRSLLRRLWAGRMKAPAIGIDNRGPDYEPLAGAADDRRIPWFLYWESAWLLLHGPRLHGGMRLLDAGGTSSLFSCYLASLGYEVHSVDLNPALVNNGNAIARAMSWRMHSYNMDMAALRFEDGSFDHAYSVCVFEHLDYSTKQAALREIARCLKTGGRLSITFDYRNPAPFVVGVGTDPRECNRLHSSDDLRRSFLSTGCFTPVGNQEFHDDGTSWLIHPGVSGAPPYTFGALFLQRV